MTSKILIVDDHKEIRELVTILLSGEGYVIDEAKDGLEAIKYAKTYTYDLIILDVMMPNLNGYQACNEIRAYCNVPILFLSAKSQDEDKTTGINCGGDDYLVKPFSYAELINKVKALIRRFHEYNGKDIHNDKITVLHGLEIDETEGKVIRDHKEIELTTIEYEILLAVIKRRGHMVSAKELYEKVWGDAYYYGANNTIMVHMTNLRKKVETNPQSPVIIRTIWGKGYRCD